MDKQLICCVDMFAITQTVVTPEGERLLCSIEDLPKLTLEFCKNRGVDKIHYFGDEKYITGFLQRAGAMADYAENKIVVEVN